ncbi:MAG: PAS domain-containing protein [Alphaproteobacteria bacterium]|nr:PAS domain-containing protein [Alphaproteobacteria bacterium]
MLNAPFEKVRVERLPLPPRDDKLLRMFELWNEQRDAAPLPGRPAVKPESFHFMLGFINLIEVADGPPFRLRLIGTSIAQRRDFTMKGKTTESLRPRPYRDMVERHYAECRDRRTPTLYHVYLSDGEHTRSYRRLMLPYADADGAVGLVVTGTHYIDRLEDVVRNERFLSD